MERTDGLGSLAEWFADLVAEKVGRLPRSKRLLSLEEAAEYYGMSEESIRELMAQQKVKPVGFLRKLQFDIVDLDGAIEAQKKKC